MLDHILLRSIKNGLTYANPVGAAVVYTMLANAKTDMAAQYPFDLMCVGNNSPRYAHSGPITYELSVRLEKG